MFSFSLSLLVSVLVVINYCCMDDMCQRWDLEKIRTGITIKTQLLESGCLQDVPCIFFSKSSFYFS